MTGQLLERGLVALAPDPADARQLLVSLTAEGESALRRCSVEVADIERRATARLTDHERAAVFSLLSTTASTIAGGWFGDDHTERAATLRRSKKSST